MLMKHASNINEPSSSISYSYFFFRITMLLISAGEIAWPNILTTNLERQDICKTVPFKVAHFRLIGLGD